MVKLKDVNFKFSNVSMNICVEENKKKERKFSNFEWSMCYYLTVHVFLGPVAIQ